MQVKKRNKVALFFPSHSPRLFLGYNSDKNNDGFLDNDEIFVLCKDVIRAQIDTTVSDAKKSGAPSNVTERMKKTLEALLEDRNGSFSEATQRVWKKLDCDQDGKVKCSTGV